MVLMCTGVNSVIDIDTVNVESQFYVASVHVYIIGVYLSARA